MAAKKYSVTLPEELAEEILREVGPGGFGAYLTAAVERRWESERERYRERDRERERLGELVAWMEKQGGPVTEAEMAAAQAERREVERHFAAQSGEAAGQRGAS
ncbi:hypothetical protein [Streptomyces sp. NPDC059398]|uniref:hypothetical protein n=1 Tax=Streptomyces sp. NPDC059398 TaxID=3346820 RepID=UPI003695E372